MSEIRIADVDDNLLSEAQKVMDKYHLRYNPAYKMIMQDALKKIIKDQKFKIKE